MLTVAMHVEAVYTRQHVAKAANTPRDAEQQSVRRERAMSARMELHEAAHLIGGGRSHAQRDAKCQRRWDDDD